MSRTNRALLSLMLTLASPGCALFSHRPVPVVVNPATGPAEVKSDALQAERESRAAASIQAATKANQSNADSAAKEAVSGELSVAEANLPTPKPEHAAEALERVNKALSGQLDTAQAEWRKWATTGMELRRQNAALEEQAKAERETNAAKLVEVERRHKEEIAALESKFAAEQRHLLNWLFHGGGFVLCAAGIACFAFASSVPALGPRAGLALIASGLTSIAFGILINWALDHLWIVATALGVPIIIAAVLLYSNHKHAAPAQPISKS